MLVRLERKFFTYWFRWKNFINKSGKKIFFYTDSRGHDVLGHFKRFARGSYVEHFFKEYNVTYYICPEKYTMIVDFLVLAEKIDLSQYDYVVLHCGVVDFSPRPLSNIENVKASKDGVGYFDFLFKANSEYYAHPTDVEYYNEKTINLYSPAFLRTEVIPKLKKIKNLVWVNSNHFVSGWEGNFKKGRPANINQLVADFDNILVEELPNVVNIKDWSDEEVKKFTIDNIHFTKQGFKELYKRINAVCKRIGN